MVSRSTGPRRSSLLFPLGLTLLALFAISPTYRAQDESPIAVEAGGRIEVVDETAIQLRELTGTITLRAGRAGELQFAARALDNRREERAVELWLYEKLFRFRPVAGLEHQPVLMEIAIPPGMHVDVVMNDSTLKVSGLHGSVDVRGRALRFDGRGLHGDVEIQIQGGEVKVQGSSGELNVSGSELQLELGSISGYLALSVEKSSGKADQLTGDTVLDLEETQLSIVGANHIEGDLNGGRLQLTGAQGNTRLRASSTPLEIVSCGGEVDIETDADVAFQEIGGALRLTSYGGKVSGAANGGLNIQGSNLEVSIEQIGGNALIEGDSLELKLKEIKGNLTINTSLTNVYADSVTGLVTIANDIGNIVVHRPARDVQIKSSDGLIKLTEPTGAVRIEANGPEVVVHWTELSRVKEHYIENEGGLVRAMFAPQAGGSIEAEARDGEIHTSIEGITLSDGGSRAEGVVHNAQQPSIRIVSEGDVYLEAVSETPQQGNRKQGQLPSNGGGS